MPNIGQQAIVSKAYGRQLAPETSRFAAAVKAIIEQHDPTANIMLFGSRARGNEEEDSD